MARHTLAITGMHCAHCVTKVSQALQGIEGVESVAVFLEEGAAEVDATEGASTEQMTAAVTAVGYPATLTS